MGYNTKDETRSAQMELNRNSRNLSDNSRSHQSEFDVYAQKKNNKRPSSPAFNNSGQVNLTMSDDTKLMKDAEPIPLPRPFKASKKNYNLEDFHIKAKLGEGAFGNVYLVELKEDDDDDVNSLMRSDKQKSVSASRNL